MVGRDESSETKIDSDDWFADPDVPSVEKRRDLTGGDVAAAHEPTWLEDAVEPEEPEPAAERPFTRRRVVVVAGALLVLVVAVVVAVVAFGGGGSSTPPLATTPVRATTTVPAATAPATPPPPPATPAANLPAGVLRPGATGADVKALQRALARAGQSPGPIDADYGPKTEEAVSAFQRSAGITVDGTYGPQTKKALEEELNSR